MEGAHGMSEKMTRAALLRLYPNREQAALLRRWQGSLRYVWNQALDCAFTFRSLRNRWPSKSEIQALVVAMKKEPDTGWLAAVPAHALLSLADDIHKAFSNWLKSLSGKRKGPKMGRPKFRGRYDRQFSVYCVNQATSFGDGFVKLPKLGAVRLRGGNLPEGRLLSSRVYCEAGKWFMASIFECGKPELTIAPLAKVGIDMGLSMLATVYDGEGFIDIAKLDALKKHEQRLKRYQRSVSRRVKGSARRNKAKAKLARQHQRVAAMRKDYAHKATTGIVARAQVIQIETLNVKGWMKNRSIAKSAADAAVSMFLNLLKYKAEAAGRTLVEVGQWEPTSKRCSYCGTHNASVVLGVKQWLCGRCGTFHLRDRNAARNIFSWCGEERRFQTLPCVEKYVETWRAGPVIDQAGARRRNVNLETGPVFVV